MPRLLVLGNYFLKEVQDIFVYLGDFFLRESPKKVERRIFIFCKERKQPFLLFSSIHSS
jgi:hypothetical protein